MRFVVNGTERTFFEPWLSLTYEQLCTMAGKDPVRNPSVTFKGARYPESGEGTVLPGDRITVQTGTVVNVMETGSA